MTLSEYHPEAANGNGFHPLESLTEQLESPQAEPELTLARMAALNGFQNSEDELDVETGADVAGGLTTAPEEDPLEVKTERSLHNNPMAKMGLVSAGTFGAVAVAGLFLSATFEGGKQPQTAQTPAQPADPLVQQTFPEKAGSANGQVLTDLALSQQQQELSALNEKGKKLTVQPSTVAPKRVQPTRMAAQPPTPQRISYATAMPQRLNYSPPRPTSFALPNGPRISRISAPPKITSAPAPRTAPQAQQDPMSAWLAAAQMGSYGGNSVVAPAEKPAPVAPEQVAMAAPELQPVSASSNNQPFLTSATYTTDTPALGYQPVATSTVSSALEEAALLSDQTLKSVNPGATATATLVTPIVLDQNASTGSQVLELKNPIKAADGAIVLPAGTQLVTQLRDLSGSGAVNLAVVAAITQTNGQPMELSLPEGAIQILGSKGSPLMAKRLGDSGGGFLSEFKQFALGAARQAAELYTRSDSTVVSNGSNTVVTTRNQQPNLLAGIVQGGTDAIFNNLEQRQQAEAAALSQQANVWGVKTGTEVQVMVRQPLMLPAFGDTLPASTLAEESQFLQSPFEFAQEDPFAPAPVENPLPEAVELMNIEGFKIPVDYTLNSQTGSASQSFN